MQMKTIALLMALAALTAFGCAPSQLGDRTLTADKPLLNDIEEYGEAEIQSQGENITLTITIPPAPDVCRGEFSLQETYTNYMIPFVSVGPSLLYSGEFDGGLPSKCLDLIGHPGGTPLDVIIQQPILFGTDNLVICDPDARVADNCVGVLAIYTINDL